MTTDAKHVENLAGLSEVKSSTPKGVDSCRSRDVPQRCGSRFVPRIEQARAAPGPGGEKVHRHHSASARETHAGGELVQCPGGDLHGPGSSPSHDEQVRSAG